jgi:hypothetical protein
VSAFNVSSKTLLVRPKTAIEHEAAMTAQTVELSPELYARLRAEAERQGRTPGEVAHEWLSERLDREPAAPHTATTPSPDREQVRAALRAAGLLLEPTPEEITRAESVELIPEKVREAPNQAGRDKDRNPSVAAMRAAGLLAEPSPAMLARAARATLTLEEISAALDRAEGKPLSEIIIEQRGPKG